VEQHRSSGNPIDTIADDPAPEFLARMSADLVCPAGQRLELDQAASVSNGEQPPAGRRLAAARVGDHLPSGAFAGHLGKRYLDHTLILRDLARDDRKIIFLDASCLERLLECRASLRRASEQQAAAGVHVEPVHRRRRSFEAALKLVDPCLDRIPAPPRSIHGKARGLSRTSASASMKRMASDSGTPRPCGSTLARASVAVDAFVTPLQRIQGIQRVRKY
jgi:hypothetical protein